MKQLTTPMRMIIQTDNQEELTKWVEEHPEHVIAHNLACICERIDLLINLSVQQQKMMINLGNLKKGMNPN